MLKRGNATDLLNPAIIRFRDGFFGLFSEYDGKTWHTVAATSSDGLNWSEPSRVLSPEGWEGGYIAANGSALVVDGTIFYWYQAGSPPRIALARSNDGRAWTRQGEAVVPLGPRGSFDERAVADPYVIRSEGMFYMFYLGQDRAARQRLGVARSSDGVVWEKLRDNPVLELGERGAFDEYGLGEPAVWSSGGSWWMLYTGRAKGEKRAIGLARSADGVHWSRVQDFGPLAGDQDWNAQVLCDPEVEELADGRIRVWFGGGDVPSPDQNLHGQIGVGYLVSVGTAP